MTRASNTDLRRAQITAALRRVMARSGYDRASISDIAAEAGLTPGLVHYHFKSKLEILVAVLLDLAAAQDRDLDQLLALSPDNPAAQLAAIIDLHLATGRTADPDALACWVTLSAEAIRTEEIRLVYQSVTSSLVHRLVSVLQAGIKQRVFRTATPDAAAAAIAASIQGYFVLAATNRAAIPRGSASSCVRSMVAGLLHLKRPLPTRRLRR
jgi:TetR/AcrR family transcriptional regulator, transcriptional repressor of bet genes